MSAPTLPPRVKHALRALERRLFLVLFAFGCGRTLLQLSVLVTALYGLDRLLEPPTAVRLVLEGLALAMLLWWMRDDLLRPLRRRPARRDLAAIYERHVPSLGDRLATAVAYAEGRTDGSPALLDRVVAEAEARAPVLDPRPIVPTGRARRSLLSGGLAVGAVLGAVGLFPNEAAVFWQRALGSDLAWPSATRLVLMPVYLEGSSEPVTLEAEGPEDFRLAVARGSVLSLRIRAEGEVPERVVALGGETTQTLSALGGGDFVLRLAPLQEETTLRFRGGDDDDDRPRLRLQVGDPPRLAAWEVRVTPPSYTGLPPEVGEMHEVRALQGSTIELSFRPDRATEEVAVSRLDGTPLPLEPTADGGYRTSLTVATSGELALAMTGIDGFRDDRATVLRWIAVQDRAPEPQVLFPDERWLTVPGGSIPLALAAEDDYGLALVELFGAADAPVPLADPQGARTWSQSLRLAAPEELSAEGFGEARFRFRFAAQDVATPDPSRRELVSPWVEVVPAVVEEQRLSERIVRLRGRVEELRGQSALMASGAETPSLQRTRRLVRDLEAVLASSERLLLERLYSGLDRGSSPWLPRTDQALQLGFPRAGTITGLFEDPLTAPPLDRAGMLLDLGRALSLARTGPGEALLQAVQDQAPVVPPATELTEQLDSILRILLSWEDFNSAINLLRSLLERQRGLYLRTREASER
ncbi:MAG: DUF4175 family protein [Planctomycetota bacterium]